MQGKRRGIRAFKVQGTTGVRTLSLVRGNTGGICPIVDSLQNPAPRVGRERGMRLRRLVATKVQLTNLHLSLDEIQSQLFIIISRCSIRCRLVQEPGPALRRDMRILLIG